MSSSSLIIRPRQLLQFGQNVRRTRLQAKLSQEQLAFKSGIHRNYISSIERGRNNISLLHILMLIKTLQIRPEVLFDGIDLDSLPNADRFSKRY